VAEATRGTGGGSPTIRSLLKLTPNRDFRLIWSAAIVSQLGDWSARLALALLILARGGGATTVGIAGMLFVLPWLGVGQALTGWSARFGRRAVMAYCDLLRAVVFILIGTVDMSLGVLMVLVGAAAMADPVFEANKSAFVVDIVDKDEYSSAIQVTHAANQASSLVGYAMGGVLVGLVGAETTLALNGATFAISAFLVTRVRRPGTPTADESSGPSFAAGLRFLRSDRVSAVAFLATMVAVGTAMSVESQVAVYGTDVAGLDEAWVGILSAVTPAATLVAVALLKTTGSDDGLLRRGLLIGTVAAAVGSTLFSLAADGVLAFVAFALVGVIFSFATLTNVVVGRRIPEANRVSIFSILQTGVFFALSLGALLGGIISEATSPEAAAAGALVVGAFGLALALPFAAYRPLHAAVPGHSA